ncbi:MAG: N5-carboxyaminoimidazole ribonucleotide synthase [Phycisphaerales bacterium]|nr:N5-carboxyaminoimidazole ribonucleotide synthase [Phycisphaerales bacterium]
MGALIGILGGGQLARMLALAGYPLGLRFRVLDPAPDAPAGAVAEHICGSYEDKAALNHFALDVSVITYEFENVPASSVEHLATHVHQRAPIYPPPLALATGQDRLLEKQLFERLGIGVPRFARVDSPAELEQAVMKLGRPAVLKTRRLGYDGKGQARIMEGTDLGAAYRALCPADARPGGLILEEFVAFDVEASVIAVRSRTGEVRTWPLVLNEHSSGILRRSRAPLAAFWSGAGSASTASLDEQATVAATRIMEALDYVGVLAVEFFVKEGRLLASEIAPRVHNSGHWTIEGSITSQFENHLRAVAGLPLGETGMRFAGAAAVMHNLVGAVPEVGEPTGLLGVPGCHVHLYGKSARPGRKVGHATVVGAPAEIAVRSEQLRSIADQYWQA